MCRFIQYIVLYASFCAPYVLADFTSDGIVFEIVIDLNAGVDPVVTIAGWRDLDWGEIQPVL